MMPDAVTTIAGSGRTAIFGAGGSRIASPSWIFGIGDSKTEEDVWLPALACNPRALARGIGAYLDRGVSGRSVATTVENLATVLAQPLRTSTPTVLINLGAADVTAVPLEARWKADYLTVIDAVRAIWPAAPIYITRAWRRGYMAEANTLAGWIADVTAARADVHLGDDERVWVEGGDDGVTMTIDGIHYTPAGEVAAEAQKAAVLWPG